MKNQTGKFAKISLIILLGMFLTCLLSTSAFAVDFITKKKFEAQKSPYQDYPLKILFKKLAESDASEKRIIRNTIILKQVFDRNEQEKIKAGLISYQETFGTISNISSDNLKLWLPKTNGSISFYLGIDHIPLVNDDNYEILESNINKYAAVIYSLDNRVYQIKISFLPAAPDGLYMQRKIDKNIVGWKRPATAREPVGYKLFINEELFGQVKETHVKVPRTSGQVDEYYVKAVYKHGNGLIESDASDIQTDEITAKEVQQEILAWETYNRIVAALNPSEWQKAEKLLYDNQQFLSNNLDQERQQNTALLVAFFKDIDAGDRLSQVTPASVKSIESALIPYQSAAQKATSLPPGLDVEFVHRLKINASQEHLARLQTQQKELAASQTYDSIVAALNPSEWQTAEKLLYDNQQFLSRHLTGERIQNTLGLIAFFREIDAGDRFSTTTPASVQNLESALMFYQRAEKKAGALPAAIDVEFIYRPKINESQHNITQIQAEEQKAKELEMVSARSPQAESKVALQQPEPAEKILRATRLKMAMKDFNTRNYASSLNHFQKVYGRQIAALRYSGRTQIRALLSLPTKHRAEIIFLTELSRLRKDNDDDVDLVKEGLEILSESVEDGGGRWSIIPQSKRRKIILHIEKYGE